MRRRMIPAALTAVLLAGGLAACTSSGAASDAADCVSPLQPGALSESVKLSGETSADLTATMSSDFSIINAQRSIVRASEDEGGRVATADSIVAANFAYFDSSTGELLQADPSFGTGGADSLFNPSEESSDLVAGVICARAGDWVAIALSPEESEASGVFEGSLVAVAEIVEVFEGRASGSLRLLPSGFPAVTTDETGQPGVVLPPQDAPSETVSAVRIQGKGAPVEADQTIVGHVLTVSWDGSVLTNSWNTGWQSFGTEAQMQESSITYRDQLTGHPVGSQVVVIEPNDGNPRVSVIDIVAVV